MPSGSNFYNWAKSIQFKMINDLIKSILNGVLSKNQFKILTAPTRSSFLYSQQNFLFKAVIMAYFLKREEKEEEKNNFLKKKF